MKESLNDRIIHAIIVLILIFISLAMIFPLYYIIVVSISTPEFYNVKGGMVFFPNGISFESYQYLLNNQSIFRSIKVSVIITVAGTLLGLIVTSSLSYSLSRKRLTGRRVIQLGILISMIFSPGIIPHYLLIRNLGLIDNLWALILPALTNGYYVILMRGFFDEIPQSLEDAALIDGCHDLTIWYKIILPLSLPSIAAFSVFFAVGYWNTFISAVLYINNSKLWPLQVIIRNLINAANGALTSGMTEVLTDVPTEVLKMAAIVIAVVPILLVYPFLQKYFTKGLMLGSIKE